MMGSQPQEPKRDHSKNISVVLTTEVVNSIGPQVACRKRRRKFSAGKNSEILLEPQPSDSAEDPLVNSNNTANEAIANAIIELAKMEERACLWFAAPRNCGYRDLQDDAGHCWRRAQI